VSPTPTLVLDKLLFLQILYLILKPSIAAAVKVFNISKITSFISKYQESIQYRRLVGVYWEVDSPLDFKGSSCSWTLSFGHGET